MGLWNFITKMAQGKPVFEQPPKTQEDDHAGWVDELTSSNATNPSPFVDERGRKVIPEITVERCRSHLNGNHMDVTAWFTNASEFEIELDKITLLDMKTVIGRRLQPHEGHEVTLYRGPQPSNDHDQKASLSYKMVQNGDYFRADFRVEYNRESSGLFTVEQLHPDHIVHDI